MRRKTARSLTGLAVPTIVLVYLALTLLGASTALAEPASSPSPEQDSDSFTPTVLKPTWVDQDNNAIADTLDWEISERNANGSAHENVNVTVMLKAAPTSQDAEDFTSAGGYLTTSAWTEATYGFGGMITYSGVADFAHRCPNLVLIEKEVRGKAAIAYAAKQVGARTYVWNTLGLQGDPDSSTAILDTGIDGSHQSFSPGYGDGDFSKKIVGWTDQVGGAPEPVDGNGHGSHVAGLAGGNGFFSVDVQGRATATYGANLGGVSSLGWYVVSGMMVNRTGLISVNVKWTSTGTARLAALALSYGDKSLDMSSWSQAASVNAPLQNTFYALDYNVASNPAGGYDMYHIYLSLTRGTGDLYVTYMLSWPYTPAPDGFQAWTGIAPQSKLVGVRVLDSDGEGGTNQMIDGINWIIANRINYHITVASMSIGFDEETAQIDAAVLNLVNSGVATIVSAGNEGSGTNSIYTPGSVDEVMTVAGMNQFDNIASYSSQGGTSTYTGKTLKPDVAAPGGSFVGVPLYSADTNQKDADGFFADIQADDSAPMQGTSMAAPVVAGSAQIVIQAMGGYASWNWTRSQALQPKMILLMTATETYPNLRELETSSASPTLQRGGKDAHEGYGRVNLDAAVDALLKSYSIASTATDSLGRPPTAADISLVGQRLAWTRNVQLFSGGRYNFTLTVPSGADYDLYLYNSTGTAYGEPAILARSTNATVGGTEQFWVAAPYTGIYYVVVKRATEDTGSGDFTLSSSGPRTVNVTLNTPGLLSASNVVHYVQDGVYRNGSVAAYGFSDFVDVGTTLAIDNPIYVSAAQRYLTTDPTAFAVQLDAVFTVNYGAQYFVAVNSSHGAPPASQWVNQGSSFTASVTSPTEIIEGDSRWICTGFSVDEGTLEQGTSHLFANVQAPHTIVFSWKRQFYLTINSPYGSTTGAGWQDAGTTASAVLSAGTLAGGTGVQYAFAAWSGDASGTDLTSNGIVMDSAKTATASWKTQYFFTLSSAHGVASGEGWYDSGASASAEVSPLTVDGSSGTRYVFVGWSGDASGTTSPSNTITMDSPKAAVAEWKTQYYLTASSAHGTISGAGWYDSGTYATATLSALTVDGSAGTRHVFIGWSNGVSGTTSSTMMLMDSPKTAVANWKTQHYLSVNSAYGTSGGAGWYDAGSTAYATLDVASVSGGTGIQRVFRGWGGDASGAGLTSDGVTMNGAKTATAGWKTQYYLTVSTAYGKAGGSGWYDSGASASATLPSLTVPAADGARHTFTGWSGDASDAASPSNQITMDRPKTAVANWKMQYYLNLSTNFGSVNPGSGWYDAGSTLSVSAGAPSASDGERFVWNGWSGSSAGADNTVSVTMNGAVTETASWTHQYMVEVTSPFGSAMPSSGWFDAGTVISASVNSPVTASFLTQHVCIGWTGTGSAPTTGTAMSLLFTVEQPSSIAWNWETRIVLATTLLVVLVPLVAAIAVAVYLLLRHRFKRQVSPWNAPPSP